jgi:hypothetical protein
MAEDNGPKTAAAPLFSHKELLDGFRQIVQDYKEFLELRGEQKHVDFPDDVRRHRMQVAFAVGKIVKQLGPVLPALHEIAALTALVDKE